MKSPSPSADSELSSFLQAFNSFVSLSFSLTSTVFLDKQPRWVPSSTSKSFRRRSSRMSLPSSSEFAAGKYVKQPIFFSNVDGGQSALALDLLFSSRISEAVDFCVRFFHTPHLRRKFSKRRTSALFTQCVRLDMTEENLRRSGLFFNPVSAIHSLNIC